MRISRFLASAISLILILSAGGCAQPDTAEAARFSLTESPAPTAAATLSAAQTPAPDPAEQTSQTLQEQAEQLLQNMTTAQKVGQLIIFGISEDVLSDTTAALVAHIQPGGIALTSDCFQNPNQVLSLVCGLNAAGDTPLIIACTEEGGRVSRITGNAMPSTLFPGAFAIGQTGDPALAYRAGEAMAQELLSLGVNLDFAPVADIWNNPENTVISDRSFGSDPEAVAEFTAQMVLGVRSQGLGTTLKHFPGHGNTFEDSHNSLTYCNSTLEQLFKTELVPFIAGIQAGADAVMIAHVVLPGVQSDPKPATVSAEIVTGLLREELGFTGLIVTDSMHMKGLTDFAPIPEASVAAILAGVDLLLVDDSYAAEVFSAVLAAAQDGTISAQRLDESVQRILMFKISHGLMDPDLSLPDPAQVLGCSAHQALVSEILWRAAPPEEKIVVTHPIF